MTADAVQTWLIMLTLDDKIHPKYWTDDVDRSPLPSNEKVWTEYCLDADPPLE